MHTETGQGPPDARICEQARLSRDPRFDGLFFTAVTTTHIYCRPVCPVPTVRHENVRYYSTAAAAEKAGYRPCLRCRPELSPGLWRRGDASLERALRLIDDGFLADGPLAALAGQVGLSERQLRRLFVERFGASPLSVHATRRLLFAKQLLTETELPITQVALESGFGSVRRFNASFRNAYRMSPSDLRRRKRPAPTESMTLRLQYRPPYDFEAMLDVMAEWSVPGIELADGRGYARTFGSAGSAGWLRLARLPGRNHALELTLHSPTSARILDVATRLKRMFDLDADPRIIHATLAEDPRLEPLLERHPGLRLPGPWNGVETALRLLIERQCPGRSAAFVRCLGTPLDASFPDGLERLFPAPAPVAAATDDELVAAGLTRPCAGLVRRVARAAAEGALDFRWPHTLDSFIAEWRSLTGDDDGAAHEVAMRALGHPDAFPAHLAARNAARSFANLAVRSEIWRPWRAYAVMLLMRGDRRERPAAAPVLPGNERLQHERRSP